MMARKWVTLNIALLCLCLAGCDQDKEGFRTGRLNNDIDTIRNFTIDPPPAIEIPVPKLRAPDDPLRLRLHHIDPITLADAIFYIDGSDTISPVTQWVYEEFNDEGFIGTFRMNQSSTGTGMKALCRGEAIDLVNASRRMKASERAICDANNIEPVHIKIGYDPFVLITHADNDWLTQISRAQLGQVFKSNQWRQINPNYPDRPLTFYVRGKTSGSMDAMTEFVYGDKTAPFIREVENGHFYDYELELTRDLAEDPNGIGFASFGKLAILKQLKVKIIPIDKARPVTSGALYPINRSLYIVTSKEALKKTVVQTFIAHYLNRAHEAMPPLGFAPLEGREARRERLKFIANLTALDADNVTVSTND
ncbi:MAG: substrate-binding domain-containing protein [Parvularculaceae bacterium]